MLFSIIIVNYNGKNYLIQCLDSIFKNTQTSFEIIVVDNHSTDGSVAAVKSRFPKQLNQIHLVRLTKNFGPAQARNRGVAIAKGKYLAFLDNDTQVHPDWLTATIKVFAQDKKIGCIQSKLLLANNHHCFDYAGDYLNQYGLLSHRATYQDIDRGQFQNIATIFAAKSAGMFIRRSVFDLIGGFDKDYFIYLEETDLCWRSWLQGYTCLYLPTSIVYHQFSGSFKLLNNHLATFNLRFHGTKNYLLTNIKNLSSNNLLHILPRLIIIYLLFSLYLLLAKLQPIECFYILKGIAWNIVNIKNTLDKRRLIQKNRILSDSQLFPYIFRRINLLDKNNTSIFLKNK